MRVAELIGIRMFRIAERVINPPQAGEVQVRVAAVGVCGSDLHSYCEGGVGDSACLYPMVLGHEPVGIVSTVGTGVTGWSVGDKAILEPAIYCYHCRACQAGRNNLCENVVFLSTPSHPGFFREFVNLPAANLLPLPQNVSLAEGTLAEPLAVVLHSLQFAALQAGETAAVFGAGPMGLLTIAALKLAGARRIFAVDPVPHRRQMALALGADAALDPLHVAGNRDMRDLDLAIDCVVKGGSLNQALEVCRAAGRVVVTGIPAAHSVDFAFHTWRRKELQLFVVRRSNRETPEAISMLRERPQRFAPMITHTPPLNQIENAFAMLETYQDGVGKIVMAID